MKNGAVVLIAAAILACGGARREKYLAKGNQSFQHGQYAEAAINYRKALQADPNFGEAYYRLGIAEAKLDHVAQSFAALSRAVDLMPENDGAKAMLGDLYLVSYQQDHSPASYEKLNQISDQLLARNPQSFAALRLKGYMAIANGKPDRALHFFARANSIRPLVPGVAITLTQTLLLEGRTGEALELARSLMALHPDAGPIYDTLYGYYVQTGNLAEAEQVLIAKIKNNPADSFPVLQLAEHYWRHNQRPQSERTIHSLLRDPKAFPQAYMAIGDFYRRVKEADEAVRAFEAGASENPKEKLVYEKLAIETLMLAGKLQQALDRIGTLLSVYPADDGLQSTRAALLLDSPLDSDRKLALQGFEELVRKAPNNTAWRFQLGRAYAAHHQLAEARQQFEIVVGREPDHTLAWLALAEVASRSLDFAGCQRYAEEALGRDPSLRSAHLLRASALVGFGRFNEARAEYNKLVRDYPAYREARLQRALLDVVEGHYAEAEKEFRANYDPSHRDFRSLEGLIAMHFSQGRPDQAFELLQAQAAHYPDSMELVAMRASAAGLAGHWDAAIREYERLHSQKPDDPGVLLALGDAYRHSADFVHAIPVLERAQTLRPTDWRAPYLLGYAYQMSGKPRQSEAAYKLCLKLNPDYPDALNNLAFLLAEGPAASAARLDEALALAQKAVRATAGNVESSDTLGWIYLKQGHLETAQQLFSGLLVNNPGNPALHYHFGMVLRQKGDRAASEREFRAALQTGLSPSDRQAVKQLLTEK